MAKIPLMGSGRGVRAVGDRPADASAAADVEVARQIQNAGRALGSIGTDLMEKRAKAEAADYTLEKKTEYRRNLNDRSMALKARYKEDPEAYAKEMEAFANEERDRYLEEAPSERAKNQFKASTEGLYATTLVDVDTYKNIEKANGYFRNKVKNINSNSNYLMENPNPEQAVDMLADFQTTIDAQSEDEYPKEVSEKLKEQASANYREGLVKGLLLQDQLDVAEEFLEGKMKGSEEILSNMDPGEKASYLKAIKSRRETKKTTNNKLAKYYIQNAVSSLTDGNIKSPAEMAEIRKVSGMVGMIKDPLERKMAENALNTAMEEYNVGTKFHTMSDAKIQEAIQNPKSLLSSKGLFNFKNEEDARKRLKALSDKIFTMRNKDGAGYIKQFFPAVTDPAESYQLQKALGIRTPSVIPLDLAKTEGKAIRDAKEPAAMLQLFDNFLAENSNMSKEATEDMIRSKALPSSISIVAATRDNDLRMSMLDSALNYGEHKKLFDTEYKGEYKKINEMVSKKAKDFFDAVANISSPETLLDMRKLIEGETFKNRKNSDSLEDAVNKAVEDVVDRQYQTITYDNGWWGKNRTAIVPTSVNRRMAETFLEKSLDNLQAEDLDISVEMNGWVDTPEYIESTSTKGGHTTRRKIKDPKKKFFEQLSERAQWVPNKSQTGYMLQYLDISGRVGYIRDSNGSPVEVTFKQMPYMSFVSEELN